MQGEGSFEGRASGCGYDKESAAFASAAKGSFALKKILCELKEAALKEGKSDKSETAYTEYDPIPAFEAGVGMNSIIAIFRRYGYNVIESHGKRYDSYELELKKEEE